MPRAIKDPLEKADRFRMLCLILLLLFLFSLLLASFYRLQITETDKWQAEAKKQHFFVIKESAVRGSFISNTSIKKNHPDKEQKFVVDIQKFHLHSDPQSIPDEYKEPIAQELIARLNLS